MKIKVKLFAPFRELFNTGEGEVELNGVPDVRRLLDFLCDTEKRREKIFEDSGELRPYVMVLINGKSIRMLNDTRTELEEGDEVALFPPVSGG
jgi:sulfur-carrier protein